VFLGAPQGGYAKKPSGVVPEHKNVVQHSSKRGTKQMLYDVDGPQASDGPRARWAAAGQPQFRVQGPGCRVQGAGFRVQGSGFRV
jgi:hypothetical protein